MIHGVLLSLHVLAAVIWVGGMFYAYMAMRPAVVARIEKPQRPGLWRDALGHFFFWVWISVILLMGSGHGLVALMGGWANMAWHVHVMHVLAILMSLIFIWVFFVPYARLKAADTAGDPSKAGPQIPRIRQAVAINLALGLTTVAVAAGGAYW